MMYLICSVLGYIFLRFFEVLFPLSSWNLLIYKQKEHSYLELRNEFYII